jgi:hypothetical protein
MAESVRALTLQLSEWIAGHPRTYAGVLEAWRTTCPQLSIWEDACIDGLIDCDTRTTHIVTLIPKGQALLHAHRPELSVPSTANAPRTDAIGDPANTP